MMPIMICPRTNGSCPRTAPCEIHCTYFSGGPAPTDANRIAALEAELAKVKDHLSNFRESYSDLTTENRRVVDERDQARTELAKAKAERDALRTLLLDCEMIETSDGVVHLRSDIKVALEAIRARSDK